VVSAPAANGGFDPTAVAAQTGDTLSVTVFAQGQVLGPEAFVVRAHRPPTVVRSSPPPGRTDVALNLVGTIVLSQPLDTTTVNSTTVELLNGATVTPATLSVPVTQPWTIMLTPKALLAPGTTYTFVLGTGIKDQTGDSLGTPVAISFSTGTTAATTPTQLAFVIQPSAAGAYDPITPSVAVVVLDSAGHATNGYAAFITISLDSNPRGGHIHGDRSLAPTRGYSTFTELSIDSVASGYTLIASAPGLVSAISSPFDVATPRFVAVTAGGGPTTFWGTSDATCAITAAGTSVCWPDPRSHPLRSKYAYLSAGDAHVCGVTTAGDAFCWGYNFFGQLGLPPDFLNPHDATPVDSGTTWRMLSAGYAHTCGVTSAGVGSCWGDYYSGFLGCGSPSDSVGTCPYVSGGFTFKSISAGHGYGSCGVTTAGAAYCWGHLGLGSINSDTATAWVPVAVPGGLTFLDVGAGFGFACGLTTSGAAYCWGWDDLGQLGHGVPTGTYRTTPVAVAGGYTWGMISVGTLTTCGITVSGAAYCWGHGEFGALGNGATADASVPVPVSGGLSFTTLSAGDHYTCGVTTVGAVYCWGHNVNGQLGDGTSIDRSTPVKVLP
jgi:hypothetical protein